MLREVLLEVVCKQSTGVLHNFDTHNAKGWCPMHYALPYKGMMLKQFTISCLNCPHQEMQASHHHHEQ